MEGVIVAKIEPIGMERLEGTQTFENINRALMDEAISVVRYLIYADKAEDAMVEKFFKQTAENEMEHAKVMLKLLGALGEETDNLKKSFSIEAFVSKIDYPSIAEVAREEGFEDIAKKFELVGQIEKHHEERYRKLINNIENKIVFSKDEDAVWICRNCGHIVIGKYAPEVCPVCNHPQSFFELKSENY